MSSFSSFGMTEGGQQALTPSSQSQSYLTQLSQSEATQQYDAVDSEVGETVQVAYWARVFNLIGFPFEYRDLGPEEDQVEFRIGRDKANKPKNHVNLKSNHVSGPHCTIFYDKVRKKVYIIDYSTNGTFVNGTRLVKNKPRQLNDLDKISLCINIRNAATPGSARVSPGHGGKNEPLFSLSIKLPNTVTDMSTQQSESTNDIQFLEKYENRETLGSGSFGTVFRCVNKETGKVYACKECNVRQFDRVEENGADNFVTEARIMQDLKHEGIVECYEIFTSTDKCRLVMEYVDGGDLFDYIYDNGAYSEADGKALLKNILSALAYAHAKGFAHRDLKPENIFLTKLDNRVCKIGDWGSAKNEIKQVLKTFVGTGCYLAPEVLHRNRSVSKAGSYTIAADMWSLGVIMFVVFTQEAPFTYTHFEKTHGRPSINFENKKLKVLSCPARDLLRRLLQVDPEARISAEQALAHDWFA